MKLFELIEPKISSASIYRSNKGLDRVQNSMTKSSNTQFLGRGVYGKAFAHTKRPGAVIKTGVVGNFEGDGYFRYISTLAKNKWASSNPYFPRVYSIKMYDNDDGDDMYIAEIEQLHPLKQTPMETLIAIGDRAFFDFEQELNSELRYQTGHKPGRVSSKGKLRKKSLKLDSLPQGKLADSPLRSSDAVAAVISTLITAALEENNMTNIKDPLLKQALMFIKKINTRGFDTHKQNIMVRHGPGGGQLVITDPIL